MRKLLSGEIVSLVACRVLNTCAPFLSYVVLTYSFSCMKAMYIYIWILQRFSQSSKITRLSWSYEQGFFVSGHSWTSYPRQQSWYLILPGLFPEWLFLALCFSKNVQKTASFKSLEWTSSTIMVKALADS